MAMRRGGIWLHGSNWWLAVLLVGCSASCISGTHGEKSRDESQAATIAPVATPSPASASTLIKAITLTASKERPLTEEHAAVARRCAKLSYEGSRGGDDAFLLRCVSAETKYLSVSNNGVSGECLAFVGACPNLESVEAEYVLLTSRSLAALLSHPRIERLAITAEADDLSRVIVLARPKRLRRLEIQLEHDWKRERPAFPYSPSPAGPRDFFASEHRPTGDFAWLKQCTELREIEYRMPHETSFFVAVGRHLGGVERLDISTCGADVLESLAEWSRLRHLCLDSVRVDDAALARVAILFPQLTTLEVEFPGEEITPQGLRPLENMKSLKRLRLGGCNLRREHMAAIARMKQVEELSFEDDTIDDAAVAPLKQMPRLKRIGLDRTKAGEQTFAHIRGDWNDRRPWRGTIELIE